MLKLFIVILFFLLIISLSSAAFFLIKDQGKKRRTLYALLTRVTLAVSLLGLISYGIATGELKVNAPWHQPTMLDNESPSNDVNE